MSCWFSDLDRFPDELPSLVDIGDGTTHLEVVDIDDEKEIELFVTVRALPTRHFGKAQAPTLTPDVFPKRPRPEGDRKGLA